MFTLETYMSHLTTAKNVFGPPQLTDQNGAKMAIIRPLGDDSGDIMHRIGPASNLINEISTIGRCEQ
jgi:hypothetical protein